MVQSSFFRALCAIAIGVMLIQYPDNTVTWLTVAIGVLFFLSGVISCLTYFNRRRNASDYAITDMQGRVIANGKPAFPIVGVGSLLLGLLLAITPTVFITGLMYIIGIVLVLGAVNQFMVLIAARRLGGVPVALWISPSLILVIGLYVMLKPMETASLPLVILGWCSLLYGVTEIVNNLKINARRKELMKKTDSEAKARE